MPHIGTGIGHNSCQSILKVQNQWLNWFMPLIPKHGLYGFLRPLIIQGANFTRGFMMIWMT